ncbi:MAG TPA: response regulator [Candidatus Saccharimonadales bacterium]|nr:response regulator [Candidatus Saccharimonadales bacterium]
MNKVLIVEDDKTLREMYVEILKSGDFTIDTAIDGTEALHKIKSFRPDAILLDLFIPKINGMDLLKSIKTNPATKNIKVIVSTNVHVNQEELLQNGAEYVLLKAEYNPEQLTQKIQEILGTTNPQN